MYEYVFMYVCMYMYVCMVLCMYVCMYVCMYEYIYIYIYVYNSSMGSNMSTGVLVNTERGLISYSEFLFLMACLSGAYLLVYVHIYMCMYEYDVY